MIWPLSPSPTLLYNIYPYLPCFNHIGHNYFCFSIFAYALSRILLPQILTWLTPFHCSVGSDSSPRPWPSYLKHCLSPVTLISPFIMSSQYLSLLGMTFLWLSVSLSPLEYKLQERREPCLLFTVLPYCLEQC